LRSEHLRSDINPVWPSAETAVMGAEGAVNMVYREQASAAEDPAHTRQELIDGYQEKFTNPYVAANRRFVDHVIDPAETRPRLIRTLEMLQNKRDSLPAKKRGNFSL
jgi:acetyl-CoA carboxylase carboxyltransferase component